MKPDRSGNYRAWHGVYRFMFRGAAYLLAACAAFGQVRVNDPLQAKLAAIYQARTEGRFSDAAVLREEARRALEGLPADAPQFAAWVRSVAQLYASGARTVQARAVLENALGRIGGLSVTSQVRIDLLSALAESWRQDRALLRAREYLAKAIAAQEAAPPQPANASRVGGGVVASSGPFFSVRGKISLGPGVGLSNFYREMAELERELGHPAEAAAWTAKLRAMAAKGGDDELASFFEQQGQLDEAARVRKAALERAVTAEQAVTQLEDLARIYERQERADDAVAAQQQAIARMESGGEDLRGRVWNARENVARILQQAGRTDAAAAMYEDLLARGPAEQRLRIACNYATFLAASQRDAQAWTVLRDFQANHGALEPQEESAIYYAMANVARAGGDNKKAAEYQALAGVRQQGSTPDAVARSQFDGLLQQAQAAAGEGRTGDAFALAMQALDAAGRSPNRESISWMVPSIATGLAGHKETALSEQLYRRAEALAESWSDDTLQPLLNVLSNEAHGRLGQPDPRGDGAALVERYRGLLITAHGTDSGMLEDAMRMAVQVERMRAPPPWSTIPEQELAAYEESVNGNTSEPYRAALRTLAEGYDANGDAAHAIPVRRQIVALSDLTSMAGDYQRGQARADLALALAAQGEFDEAERVAREAAQQTKGHEFDHITGEVRRLRAARSPRR